MHERMKKDCPCDICIPPLLSENKETFDVFMQCQNQVIMSGSGNVVDINFVAIKVMLDLYKIENQQNVFDKIVKVFHHFLAEDREKNKNKGK